LPVTESSRFGGSFFFNQATLCVPKRFIHGHRLFSAVRGEVEKMKHGSATALLTILFLSAGAFANNVVSMLPVEKLESANVTVVTKNQSWPAPRSTSVEPCKQARCFDA
jgi:hypothetical protein